MLTPKLIETAARAAAWLREYVNDAEDAAPESAKEARELAEQLEEGVRIHEKRNPEDDEDPLDQR